eukprot:s294_g16.t1
MEDTTHKKGVSKVNLFFGLLFCGSEGFEIQSCPKRNSKASFHPTQLPSSCTFPLKRILVLLQGSGLCNWGDRNGLMVRRFPLTMLLHISLIAWFKKLAASASATLRPVGMSDLLDLAEPTPESKKEVSLDPVGTAGYTAEPAAAPAPAATPAAAEDDDWGDFASAPTSAAEAVKEGPKTTKEEASFDPIAAKSSTPAAPAPADPYNNLESMEQKKKSDDNLISFGALDEFDPVAHQFDAPGKEGASASATAEADAENFDPNSGAAKARGDGDLLGLGGAAASSSAEEPDKKMIYVYHKGEKNCVGWYSDMQADDIKEAILCACDAIMDGGFVLREVQLADEEEKAEPKEDGRVFEFEEFDQLQNGQTYIIEAAGERDDLKKITGDRFRRLKVQIDPKLHVEAVKAIDRMRRGANLLKHTHYGFPHLRQFQLSDDTKRLIWYSGAKRKEDSMVNLDEVVEIKLGQQTPVFLHYRLPMLEHLSFSIIYGPKGSKTLDLTCKDEFEFDHWVTGLKAIFYSSKNKQISKEALLAHSKRFQKAMEKNNVGIKLTKLPEVKEKGHVGLDDCIEIVTHTPQQLDTKMERLRERLKTMSQQVSRLDHHSAAEMEVDLSLLTGQGPAYASVFVQDEDAQDEEMEIRRMHELVEQTTQVLQQARNELIALNQRQRSESSASTEAKAKKKETAACKHIDQLLWKAEVDLENVEDMYLRHIDNQKETYSLADFNQRVSRTFSDIEESINNQLDSIKSFFLRVPGYLSDGCRSLTDPLCANDPVTNSSALDG